MIAKPADELTVADFEQYPIWRFVYDEEKYPDETYVTPIKYIPVKSLDGKIVGVKVRLHNGMEVWGILSNIEPFNRRMNEQFLSLSVERNGEWFHLARYHDVDYERCGPKQLADFLGLTVEDIFPISYDLVFTHIKHPPLLRGQIPVEPAEKLDDDTRIRMIVSFLDEERSDMKFG